MKKFYVVRKLSKEKKVPYVCLLADCGYRKVSVTMDTAIICETFNLTFDYVMNLPFDKEIHVGTLTMSK